MSDRLLETRVCEPEGVANASVIWMHGLGADGHDFLSIVDQLQLPASLKVRYVFPHAPVRPVTIQGGLPCRAWFDIFDLNRLDREDTVGLAQSERAIHALIEQQIALGISPHRILLAGFSQGGAIAQYAALRSSYRLGGVVGLSAYLPLANQVKPTPFNQSLPVFLAHGSCDPILPLQLGVRSVSILKKLGCVVDWYEYSIDHTVCEKEIADLGQWMAITALKP